MVSFFSFSTLLLLGTLVAAAPQGSSKSKPGPLVQSSQLRRGLTSNALLKHGQKFMDFAAASPDKSRAFGTVGHNMTVDYIKSLVDRTGYYNVVRQEFTFLYYDGSATFSAGGKDYANETDWFMYGPAGKVTAPLAVVKDMGCVRGNYPASLSGKIALISRGDCDFSLKLAYAGAAGAAGAIIYNNIPGPLYGGNLFDPWRPEGPYVPVASASQETGKALVAAVAAGTVTGTLVTGATMENRTTSNLVATTKGGDQNNIVVLGAHTDTSPAGPGINDNGSGSIGLLEIALALPRYTVKNAIRFAWWTAEEFGQVGSQYYVQSLAPKELSKIALYIDAGMIASPNFGYFIYDGDGSAFNLKGPAGSDNIEKVFEDYFANAGLGSAPADMDGRSDYVPFMDAGVPSGGLFAGAEGIKTAKEAKKFGGTAGVAYDVNYKRVGDTLANCNAKAWIENTKALAHAAAVYARSLKGIPSRPAVTRRGVKTARGSKSARGHSAGGHSEHGA